MVFLNPLIELFVDITLMTVTCFSLCLLSLHQDIDGWAKLCERLSDKCYIIGEHVYPRPERLAQEGFGELRSSGVVLKLQRLTTVTDFSHAAQVTKGERAVNDYISLFRRFCYSE